MDPSYPSNPSSVRTRESHEFTVTQWTQVFLAGKQDGSPAARLALERLCTRYWTSIYAFLRRRGANPSDAEDLTQGFFGHLLEEGALSRADPARGRFRNFLLGALQRFVADETRKAGTQKRGADRIVLAFDFLESERAYLEQADTSLTPERVFDLRWASTVLETAYEQTRLEFEKDGQAVRFDLLKGYLSANPEEGDYQRIAGVLGITPKAVSSAVCRLRERFRVLAREVVQGTVSRQEEIDAEFQELFH